MARGWESKSVEQQMDSAAADRQVDKRMSRSHDANLVRKKQSLMLSRSRVLQQLEASSHPQHRQMLETALHDLERELAELPPDA